MFVLLLICLSVTLYLIFVAYRYLVYRNGNVVVNYPVPDPCFFSLPEAFQVNDVAKLYLHSSSSYSLSISRVYGEGPKEISCDVYSNHIQDSSYSLKVGCDWSLSREISLQHLVSGYYLFKVSSITLPENHWVSPVLVRSEVGKEIVVVCPTNTWQAYNEYGGKSNYIDKVTPRDVKILNDFFRKLSADNKLAPYNYLPLKRPLLFPSSSAELSGKTKHLNDKVSSDLYFIEYLEKMGKEYDVISDDDFAKGIGLENAKVIIFHNHSEYWAYEGIGILKQMISSGKSIVFLSGNNIFREVERLKGDTLIVMEQQIDRSFVEPVIGTYYSESGYDCPFSSFRVMDDSHWVFDGTGLLNGDVFGKNVVSGIETDKLGPFSEGFKLLAIGNNTAGPAHLVIKEFEKGNFVFNASSISAVRALEVCEKWREIISNVIAAGLKNSAQG